MGERTFLNRVNTTFDPEPKQQPLIKPKPGRLDLDITLILVTITLSIFGLLMVYSTTFDYTYIFNRQLFFLIPGFGAMIFCAWMDYHQWQKFAFPLMLVTIVLLILVLIIGRITPDPARALIEKSGRPSELAKITLVIYLAVWLIAKHDQMTNLNFGLIPLIFILGTVGALIRLQPDLSAAITVFLLGALMFFLAGSDLRQFTYLMVGAFVVAFLFVSFSQTGRDRMAEFRQTLEDPTMASDPVQLSLGAFIKGGWIGVGIGKGVTKLTGLPLPHSDSIFAVIGEETGVLGALILVFLYLLMLWRSLLISKNAPDKLGHLLAAGLGFWLTMEALINMGVIVGLLPAAGSSLPFISAGGSNLLVSMTAVGILLNISRLSSRSRKDQEGPFDAVVNLRGGDRRRRISRPNRPANNNK
jgi:cell division protein FtsW